MARVLESESERGPRPRETTECHRERAATPRPGRLAPAASPRPSAQSPPAPSHRWHRCRQQCGHRPPPPRIVQWRGPWRFHCGGGGGGGWCGGWWAVVWPWWRREGRRDRPPASGPRARPRPAEPRQSRRRPTPPSPFQSEIVGSSDIRLVSDEHNQLIFAIGWADDGLHQWKGEGQLAEQRGVGQGRTPYPLLPPPSPAPPSPLTPLPSPHHFQI